jgi:tRNA dimethylallyltransferase
MKLSELREENVKPGFKTLKFAISYPREILYDRINSRVDRMLEQGLIKEVQKLMDSGYHYRIHNSVNTVGVKETMMYLEGKLKLDEMIRLIKMNTRRYAKRQITWLRKEADLICIDTVSLGISGNSRDSEQVIADEIIRMVKTQNTHIST